MTISGKRVAVYHAMPLCRKCKDELSKVQTASVQAGAGMEIKFSIWKRLEYGLRFMNMPIVVIDGRPFSVLGAFGQEALTAELKKEN